MISDYWAVDGTVDARCPEKQTRWTWNDYRPVLGENSWGHMIAPLQVAFMKYGSVQNIPANDIGIMMAINLLPGLERCITSVGGVSYSPNNTLSGSHDTGYDVSTENNASLYSGLKMLRYILSQKQIYLDKLAIVNNLITNIERYIKASYDPVNGYFRQGGSYYSGQFQWASDGSAFAVDCQTWLMSVVNPILIDIWFGAGTSQTIWKNTKTLGGYKCNPVTGYCAGLGFSHNQVDQVFSGEWSLGGINMLKIFAAEYSNPSFLTEAKYMRDAIETELTSSDTIDGYPVNGVLYAQRRYYIPFGWWANPVLSTASAAWAVMADRDFNPFYLGGAYRVDYP
jgi:hypothetical protein